MAKSLSTSDRVRAGASAASPSKSCSASDLTPVAADVPASRSRSSSAMLVRSSASFWRAATTATSSESVGIEYIRAPKKNKSGENAAGNMPAAKCAKEWRREMRQRHQSGLLPDIYGLNSRGDFGQNV